MLIPPYSRHVVLTDIAIKLPVHTYGRIAPRSGIAINLFISIGGGVVDADYRGNVGIIVFNHKSEAFSVQKGDKIAQLIVERISLPKIIVSPYLPPTHRGTDGFGSSNFS